MSVLNDCFKNGVALSVFLIFYAASGNTYPIDGYQATGIGRIEAERLVAVGETQGRGQPPGALLPTERVDLRLLKFPKLDLPEADPAFNAEIIKLLGAERSKYGIAVLDISNPEKPRYAEYQGNLKQNVGSVGKLLVALGFFQTLADVYPDDLEARKRLLHDTMVIADAFIQHDHHTVRLWNTETQTISRRPLKIGDKGNLWEWLDWMLSPSSNAAAATVMKQTLLLRHFGKKYPVSEQEAAAFFKDTPKKQLGALYATAMHEAVTRNGLDIEQMRQGSFFTRYGKSKVPGTSSYATAQQLMLFSLRMEQGRLVDQFSSLELKRLLYVTERRIRYASSPALSESAVYFKSGSLYSCKEEPGFTCKKYHGNVKNYMNSVAIVESPAGENRLHYIVTLISNVLYKNSAVQHQTLGTRIHRLLQADHPPPTSEDGAIAAANFGEHLIGYEEKRQKRLLVVNTQATLEKLGYNAGGVDGKMGPNTRKAIKAFQKDQGLIVDGIASQELLEQMQKVLAESKTVVE